MHPKYGSYDNQVKYSCQNMILQIKNESLQFWIWNVNVKNFENKEKLKGESKLILMVQLLFFQNNLSILKGITFNNLWIINVKVI
jgi:hypothetical protein